MAISTNERRFLRSWEEQREGGKWPFIGVYSFGLTILFFIGSIAVGLFTGIPFIQWHWLLLMIAGSIVLAFVVALFIWWRYQRRFYAIVQRELNTRLDQ